MEYKIITDLAFTYIGLVTTMTKHYVDQGVPLIFNSSIKVNGIETSNLVFLDIEFAQKNKTRMHKKGDVLTVHTGDIGVSAVIPESLDGSLGFATIVSRITNTDVILPEYLCAFLNYGGGKEQLYKYSRDARNNLNLTDFNKLIVPVPEIEVQRSIIDRMTRLLKLIEKRNQELLLLDELVKARFVELFGHQSHNEKGLPYKTIDDVAEIYLGITHTPEYVDEGVTFISAKNTSGDYLDLSDVKYISREEFEGAPQGSKPHVNDVLFSRVGSNLGHPVILEEELELCTFVSLGFLRSKGFVTSNYLKHWMRDEFFPKQVSEHVKGGGQPNLNTGWLKQFKIIVPEMNLQLEFDDFCKQVDKSKVAIQKSLAEEQLLFDSLMQGYFG